MRRNCDDEINQCQYFDGSARFQTPLNPREWFLDCRLYVWMCARTHRRDFIYIQAPKIRTHQMVPSKQDGDFLENGWRYWLNFSNVWRPSSPPPLNTYTCGIFMRTTVSTLGPSKSKYQFRWNWLYWSDEFRFCSIFGNKQLFTKQQSFLFPR
jgi:hypothetical protein